MTFISGIFYLLRYGTLSTIMAWESKWTLGRRFFNHGMSAFYNWTQVFSHNVDRFKVQHWLDFAVSPTIG
jgi:hypothetical protein